MTETSTVKLVCTQWGTSPRRALLLHGLSSNAESWWRVGPDLADQGFSLTAPDMRGHGESGEGTDYSLAGYRDDVLALGSGWDLVVGHSLGGLVALACQLADPGFSHAMVLEDPALRWEVTPEVVAWLLEEYAEPITEESVAAEKPGWAPEDIARKVRALHQGGPEMVVRTINDLGGVDLWPRLGDAAVPVLVVGADPAGEALVTAERGAYAATLPGVDYMMVPGASHSIHRDSYDAFIAAIAGFVAQNRAD